MPKPLRSEKMLGGSHQRNSCIRGAATFCLRDEISLNLPTIEWTVNVDSGNCTICKQQMDDDGRKLRVAWHLAGSGKSSRPEVYGACALQRERVVQHVLLALPWRLFIVRDSAMPILYVLYYVTRSGHIFIHQTINRDLNIHTIDVGFFFSHK